MAEDSGHYLVDNPPKRSQYRKPRRDTPSGVVILHSTESIADVKPPDTGAEQVASFIRNRSDAGSYHRLVDNDSIVKLIPFWYEAYHDGTGTNRHSMGISGAFQAHQWAKLSDEYRTGVIRNMARAAAEYADWIKVTHGITIPARRINVEDARRKIPGFATHGMLDPRRRTDPDGTNTGNNFPWEMFFSFYEHYLVNKPPTQKEEIVEKMAWFRERPGSKEMHCYRIFGTVATWFSSQEEIQLAGFFGIPWAGGTEDKSIIDPVMWKSIAIMNGPLRNVNRELYDDEGKILAAIAAINGVGDDSHTPEEVATRVLDKLREALS